MFTTIVVQPIFNLLVLIYALLPGHNLGLAIILFTVVIRLLMWPLVKKQLHHAKAMRELQPELRRIKKESKGNKQQESAMIMELYKEREVNPFSSVGLLIIQIPIFIALYSGINRVIRDPSQIIEFTYPFIQNLGSVKELAADITKFDATLFGFIDLTRPALNPGGGIYWPAMFLVAGSALAQFFQSKQLMPKDKDSRSLRQILKDASSGKQTEQSEVNAAVGQSTKYFVPAMVFLFTLNLPSALSLYWMTSGLVAIAQQARILRKDETEMEEMVDKPTAKQRAKKATEAKVVNTKPKRSKQSKKQTKKRRK
ncbi:YidC/Oxa1 family membrane protein insertase [Candidatus Saccharibacteria bacterium]|nr:YidC/Oxa1 family membrane protein insertase [Candidatus Saccharibacteria bacterium]